MTVLRRGHWVLNIISIAPAISCRSFHFPFFLWRSSLPFSVVCGGMAFRGVPLVNASPPEGGGREGFASKSSIFCMGTVHRQPGRGGSDSPGRAGGDFGGGHGGGFCSGRWFPPVSQLDVRKGMEIVVIWPFVQVRFGWFSCHELASAVCVAFRMSLVAVVVPVVAGGSRDWRGWIV